MSQVQETSLPPTLPPCNACDNCAFCVTIKCLIGYQQALQEQLYLARQQDNDQRAALADSYDQCNKLKESLNWLDSYRKILSAAIDEGREQQLALEQEFTTERNRHAISEAKCASLYTENQTLWRLLSEIQPISSNPKQLATIQRLFHTNKQQQQAIAGLNAAIRQRGIGSQTSELAVEKPRLDVEEWVQAGGDDHNENSGIVVL